MKQRLLTSVVGLTILAIIFSLFNTIVLNIAVSIIIAIAIYELLRASGVTNLPISCVTIVFGAAIPFFKTSLIDKFLPVVFFLFAVVLFTILLKYHSEISAEKVGFIFFFTMAIAISTSCFVYVRDVFGKTIGFYAVVLSLGGSWLNDTGAYFGGMLFGKHKLAPVISPKKTVEGFVWGIIVSILSQLALSRLFEVGCGFYGVTVEVNYVIILIASPFIALVSVLGDLSASAMKCQFKIKDFGNIMPGHGGVLDRFDSALFAVPLVYILLTYFPLITVK